MRRLSAVTPDALPLRLLQERLQELPQPGLGLRESGGAGRLEGVSAARRRLPRARHRQCLDTSAPARLPATPCTFSFRSLA